MESEPGKERVVTARPGTLPWIGVGFCWLLALLTPLRAQYHADYNGSEVDWSQVALTFFIGFLPGLLLGLFAGLSRIVATTEGLRWRKWLPWKPALTWQTAAWDDITDFYDDRNRMGYDTASGQFSSVEVDSRKSVTFGHDWRNAVALREIIAESAICAESARDPNGKITWMPKGVRPSELPRTFAYSEAHFNTYWYSGLGGTLLLLGLFAIPIVGLLGAAREPRHLEWTLFLLRGLGIIELIVAAACGWSLFQEWGNVRLARQRHRNGEKFVAEWDGLTVWQGGEARKIRWGDIVGYEFPLYTNRKSGNRNGGIARFRTRTGEEFSFTPLINDYAPLCTILRRFAGDAVEFRRDQNAQEDLGGVTARWSGGEEGKGDRVFHRRTRTTQLSIMVVGLMLFPFVFFALRALSSGPDGYYAALFFLPIIAIIGFLLYLPMAEYFRERVLVGKEGVTYINKHGREKRLRWEEIDRIWTEGSVVALAGKDGRRIQVSTTGYAYGNELTTLLTERLAEYRQSITR